MPSLSRAGYRILPYEEEHLQGVAELMFHLWGPNAEANSNYLTWKYVRNPYADRPLCIVATCGGKVVGFRGFFATKWRAPNGEEFRLLSPGDTCVDPGHRRRGLSVEMGMRGIEEYGPWCEAFLNMSCSMSSIPGYLRMGFRPLVKRTYLTRATVLGLACAFLPGERRLKVRSRVLRRASKGPEGVAGDVTMEGQSKPSGMERVAERDCDGARFSLLRDMEFFTWRYRSNKKYLFCFLHGNCGIRSYVAVRVGGNRRAHIVDHGGADRDVASLVESLVATGGFQYASIWTFSVGGDLEARLRKIGFRHDRVSRFVDAHIAWERGLPLLIRPSSRDPGQGDWLIGDLRIDRIDSWDLRAIASDAN